MCLEKCPIKNLPPHSDWDTFCRGFFRLQAGSKDVLIATDIAAKGLDFPDIQHVINFDMPSEIENYVHRIGRTGRCGKTGVATTFINKVRHRFTCGKAVLYSASDESARVGASCHFFSSLEQLSDFEREPRCKSVTVVYWSTAVWKTLSQSPRACENRPQSFPCSLIHGAFWVLEGIEVGSCVSSSVGV